MRNIPSLLTDLRISPSSVKRETSFVVCGLFIQIGVNKSHVKVWIELKFKVRKEHSRLNPKNVPDI